MSRVHHHSIVHNNFIAVNPPVLKDSFLNQMFSLIALSLLQISKRNYLNKGRESSLILIPTETISIFVRLLLHYFLFFMSSKVWVIWTLETIWTFLSLQIHPEKHELKLTETQKIRIIGKDPRKIKPFLCESLGSTKGHRGEIYATFLTAKQSF